MTQKLDPEPATPRAHSQRGATAFAGEALAKLTLVLQGFMWLGFAVYAVPTIGSNSIGAAVDLILALVILCAGSLITLFLSLLARSKSARDQCRYSVVALGISLVGVAVTALSVLYAFLFW